MKHRAEVVELLKKQLHGPRLHEPRRYVTVVDAREKCMQTHYGIQELRELLDFIYGGPPIDDSERLPR